VRPIDGLESDIRLSMPARPENVAVVRHVLAALAEALELPTAFVEDMRLARHRGLYERRAARLRRPDRNR
jgi:hypothetical protein